ncbi:MAG: PH domain-containing protein [Candidatus Heimdallarchaeota archaeon]
MSEEEFVYVGTISREYVRKQVLKNNLILFFWACFITLLLILLRLYDPTFPFELFIIAIVLFVVIPYITIALISAWYFSAYVKSFTYKVQKDSIVINHGVFTKTRATIPYKRIQNINITTGIFDRVFNTYTVKIETAGHSAVSSGTTRRGVGPEGYIPGLKDPHIIENKIKEMISKISTVPSGLEDKIFKPEELAFDNFISYILSKMREGEKLKTSIPQLREKAKISASQLADKVGVPIETINYLEEGRYNPSLLLAYRIAEALKCKIEDLFELL